MHNYQLISSSLTTVYSRKVLRGPIFENLEVVCLTLKIYPQILLSEELI